MWKDDLIKILFSNYPDTLKIKDAIKLKFNNTPNFLYKYKSFENKEHIRDLLENDKMWLSPPYSFNDPYDCATQLIPGKIDNQYLIETSLENFKKDYNLSDKQVHKLKRSNDFIHDLYKILVKRVEKQYKKKSVKHKGYPKNYSKEIEKFEKIIKETPLGNSDSIIKAIYVSCFSETNDSILMWSHYAKNHEGICIEYNLKELGLNNPITRYIFPVYYSNKVFDIGSYITDGDKEFDNVIQGFNQNIDKNMNNSKVNSKLKFNNMVLYLTALNKSRDWSYEKEWRYVHINTNSQIKPTFFKIPKPKAIYLGSKINDKNKNYIRNLARKRDFEVYQMYMEPSEYNLKPVQII